MKQEAKPEALHRIRSVKAAMQFSKDTLSTDTKFDAVFADVKDFTVDVFYGHFVYLSTESSEDGYQNSIGTGNLTAAVG